MKLEELVPGVRVRGLSAQPVEVVRSAWLGRDYLHATYRDPGGAPAGPAGGVSTPDDVRGWKLGVEAMRIRYAGLIDPMLAVSSSSLRPLPHQIKAVYGELLPRTPLRYLLADDPGAGKTIMCGLYVKELMLRGDLDRCLIVAPGGLVDQWVDELWDKFRLQFRVLTRELIDTTVGVSVFDDNPRLIARMDMLSRSEELQALLEKSEWDLVVVDEAHRMSARFSGREMEATKRYGLGRLLGSITRNLLLMTATPHSGDPAAFQAFLGLLDEDRFSGKSPGSLVPGTDVMRRMLKEELLTMDGKQLFPERRASTVRYSLSADEQALYEAVSDYVRHEMNRAERLRRAGDKRGHTVGFALTVLQRRLASSPEAILRTLQRRLSRLQAHRAELVEQGSTTQSPVSGMGDLPVPRSLDAGEADRDQVESERTEDVLADAASAATTLGELAVEIDVLETLVNLAVGVRNGGQDSKWLELRSILEADVLTRDEQGAPRKIIIFSEHRDTLRYLVERIEGLPGRDSAVVEIHGGLSRPQRLGVQRRFWLDPDTSVLVATDAAGEGLNLQCAHLMVNYDLPWNPNRIEQRFGRIHRIGQTEVCHLWNMVADGTREGEVFRRLLDKMQEQSKAYQGKVFDVLGEAFEGSPLRDLLVEAVRYGDDPQVRRRLDSVIDERVGKGMPELVERRALYAEVLDSVDLDQARDRVDAGQRSRLQPHFASSWFETLLKEIGGRARRRADGLVEVGLIPDEVRAAARDRLGAPVPSRYDAVCLDPDRGDPQSATKVELVTAGHPLLEAMAEVAEQRAQPLLRDGVVMVDDTDSGLGLRVLALVMHEVVDGHPRPHSLSRRVALVEVNEDGTAKEAGPVYLDYRPARHEELASVHELRNGSSHSGELGKTAIDWAMKHLVPEHLATVRSTHAVAIERASTDVRERLGKEIAFWQNKAKNTQPHADADRGQQALRRAQEAQGRLTKRLTDLEADAQVLPRPARVLACALVIPARLLSPRGGVDIEADAVLELESAKQLVEETEIGLGHVIHADSRSSLSTVRSVLPDGLSRWVDVQVSGSTARAVSVSRTQLMHARNLGDRYRLALVTVPSEPGSAEVRYVQDPFRRVREGELDQHVFEVPWSTLRRWSAEPA